MKKAIKALWHGVKAVVTALVLSHPCQRVQPERHHPVRGVARLPKKITHQVRHYHPRPAGGPKEAALHEDGREGAP